MKQIIFFLVLNLMANLNGNCQSWGDSTIANTRVFYSVENAPKFPGGMSAYYKFLSENLEMPVNKFARFSNRIVTIRIFIDTAGKITYAKIVNSVNNEYDNAVLELTKKMPSWSPGMQNGYSVTTAIDLPIRFIA